MCRPGNTIPLLSFLVPNVMQGPPNSEMEDAERYLRSIEESFPERHYGTNE